MSPYGFPLHLITSGNRLTKNTTNYSYDRADQIQTAGATTYTVNANGNLTMRDADSFAYDQANRLISATVGGTTTTYAYDGDGRRASKTIDGMTSYINDINAALPQVLTDGTFKYVYGLSLAYAVDSSANVQVYHIDGLGSVRALTDASGDVVQTYRTDEFGIPTQTQGSSTQPFQFTGQQRDPESGLYYLRARSYDPSTGRFVERDPVGFVERDPAGLTNCDRSSPLALNPYSYAENNPLNWGDPSGMMSNKVGSDDSDGEPHRCFTIPVWSPLTGLSEQQVCVALAQTLACTAHGTFVEIATGNQTYHTATATGGSPSRACTEALRILRNSTPIGFRTKHLFCNEQFDCRKV